MNLIYVHYIGKDHANKHNYEFIFSEFNDIHGIEGDGWNSTPACGNVEPPYNFSDKVLLVKTSFLLTLIQDNDFFDMSHCKRGIIPLAWTEEEKPNIILHFFEKEEEVNNKLKT